MKKIFLSALTVLVFASLWPSLARSLPLWLNVNFLPPIILCLGLRYFQSIERVVLFLICGFIIDALNGFSLGLNMLLMLGFSFLLGASNAFLGRISRLELCYYVVGVSFFYRLILFSIESIFMGNRQNILISQFIVGPLVDGIVSVIFYYFLFQLFSMARIVEYSDTKGESFGIYS
ncbi:MAG: hypothetical protein KC505_07050 [Myxococcales bacterium]|nr:hypothetical protein [Myxococcales bacterium]USN50517.1 MAG: hypothetical protein H6731_09680 [Myxococcales bacterium]